MDAFVTELSGKSPVVEVAVRGNYAPNVFVSVLAVRGRVGDVQPTALVDLGKPAFKMGVAEINVGWRAHELNVKVTTDAPVYRVRDKAKVTIEVKRAADGKPAPKDSEVALVAVDEGSAGAGAERELEAAQHHDAAARHRSGHRDRVHAGGGQASLRPQGARGGRRGRAARPRASCSTPCCSGRRG